MTSQSDAGMAKDLNANIQKLSKECDAAGETKASFLSVLGRFKLIISLVEALPETSATEKMDKFELVGHIGDLALKVLPDYTREALISGNVSSDIAVQLVKRNLTCLPTLAKTLYDSPLIDSDSEDYRVLHAVLAPKLEVLGALVSEGMDPYAPWVKRLTRSFPTLRALRRASWAQVKDQLLPNTPDTDEVARADLDIVKGLFANAAGITDIPLIRKETLDCGLDLDIAIELEKLGIKSGAQLQTRQAVNDAIKHLADSSELNFGGDVKAAELALGRLLSLRKKTAEAKATKMKTETNAGLTEEDLEEAMTKLELEQARFKKTKESVRQALDVIDLSEGKTKISSELKEKINSAKEQVAPSDNWNGELSVDSARSALAEAKAKAASFGSKMELRSSNKEGVTDEELVAANGGLYGVNIFSNEVDVTLEPYAPILAMPETVEMSRPSKSFQATMFQTTEQMMASSYTKTASTAGFSMAEASTRSWGGSFSASGWGFGASSSIGREKQQIAQEAQDTESAFSNTNRRTTSTATVIEVIRCPMASFRIPATSRIMSKEAKAAASEVKTLLEASRFLDTYGSHVSNGRHLLGGMFFRTININSEKEVETTALMAVAADKLQESKKNAFEVSGMVGGGCGFVGGKMSFSYANASSSGSTEIATNANGSGHSVDMVRASFQTHVTSMGPNVATPEHFAQAMFADRSTWTVIDRGPFEALVPITEVIDNTKKDGSLDPFEIEQLQIASSIIRIAYKQRVDAWKDLAKQGNKVPPSLKNIILREFTQVITHDAILAAVVELFEVVSSGDGSPRDAAKAIGRAVIETAQDAKDKKAGQMEFFDTLQNKINSQTRNFGVFSFKRRSVRWLEETKRANRLSSSDWNGFAEMWEKGEGTTDIEKKIRAFNMEQTIASGQAKAAPHR